MRSRSGFLLALFTLVLLSTPVHGQRSEGEDRAELGKNITVSQGEISGDIACGRCSVYVRGTVNGDIAVFAGRVIVEGTVKGDIAAFMGRVRLEHSSYVGGGIAVFGGKISRDPMAVVGGDVKSVGAGWLLLPILVFVVFVGVIVALIVWLVTRRRPAPMDAQTPRQA